MIVELLIIGITLIAYAMYKSSVKNRRYFEERNLKCITTRDGWRGLFDFILKKKDILQISQEMYDRYPDDPMYGSYDSAIYQYIVRDPEAYRQIAVKDFDYFEDHRVIINEKMDKLWGNTLVSLHGEKWRQMRATLSPAFTGSKMRQMFDLVSECADDIVIHFSNKAKSGGKINIEMKDFFSRYTNDVIATCAFGIKVNSFADPNNEFFANGKKMMNFNMVINVLKVLVMTLAPKIANAFNIKVFDPKITSSFESLIVDTMETRQKQNIYRPDMINMMMQVREGTSDNRTEEKSKEVADGFATVEESEVGKATVTKKWNDNEIVAQCLLFFLAGFETASTALTFAAHEIMTNPNIQQKLYEEITEVNEQLDGKRISYDALQKMKYLDQVICETLRMWPPAPQTERICVRDYVFDDCDKLKFKIEKGSNIIFMLYGMQQDPKYFPNPHIFDPDRFSDENKHSIVPGTYAPFGIGPRNCIASRFALMELKAILYHLLLNFSLEPNKDTQIPLKLKKGFILVSEKGVNLELKPRIK